MKTPLLPLLICTGALVTAALFSSCESDPYYGGPGGYRGGGYRSYGPPQGYYNSGYSSNPYYSSRYRSSGGSYYRHDHDDDHRPTPQYRTSGYNTGYRSGQPHSPGVTQPQLANRPTNRRPAAAPSAPRQSYGGHSVSTPTRQSSKEEDRKKRR